MIAVEVSKLLNLLGSAHFLSSILNVGRLTTSLTTGLLLVNSLYRR